MTKTGNLQMIRHEQKTSAAVLWRIWKVRSTSVTRDMSLRWIWPLVRLLFFITTSGYVHTVGYVNRCCIIMVCICLQPSDAVHVCKRGTWGACCRPGKMNKHVQHKCVSEKQMRFGPEDAGSEVLIPHRDVKAKHLFCFFSCKASGYVPVFVFPHF